MKKLLTFLIPLLYIATLLTCNKDQSEDEEIVDVVEVEEPSDTIVAEPMPLTLTQPVNSEENYCCINFQWTTMLQGPTRFLLAKDSNVNSNTVLLDSIVSGENLFYDYNLDIGAEYFWRVEINGISQMASFSIKNVLEEYWGTYDAAARKVIWTEWEGLVVDTSYKTSIVLDSVNENSSRIRIIEESANLDKIHDFQYWKDSVTLFYWEGIETNFSTLYANLENDSLEVSVRRGGLGGGTTWTFKAKK